MASPKRTEVPRGTCLLRPSKKHPNVGVQTQLHLLVHFTHVPAENLTLPASTYKQNRHSMILSSRENAFGGGDEGLFVHVALDPNIAPEPVGQSSAVRQEDNLLDLGDRRPADGKNPHEDLGRKDVPKESRPPSSRSNSTDRDGHQGVSKPLGSPHIAYLEKGRRPSQDKGDTIRKRKGNSGSYSAATPSDAGADGNQYSPALNHHAFSHITDFKLQEAPKTKKSPGAGQIPDSAGPTPLDTSGRTRAAAYDPTARASPTSLEPTPASRSPLEAQNHAESPTESPFARPSKDGTSKFEKPRREDSLPSAHKHSMPRKEMSSRSNSDTTQRPSGQSKSGLLEINPSAASNDGRDFSQLNGGRTISKPMESPSSRSVFDPPMPPTRSAGRPGANTSSGTELFTTPRAPPQPPNNHHAHGDQYRNADQPGTPVGTLPRYSAAGEFSMDEDMARIIRGEETDPTGSMFRRVSNAVSKHGRSFSDKGSRSSASAKWKTPHGGSVEITSPISASPDSREDASQLRHQLRRAQQRIAELEAEKNGLQERVNGSADISQVNTELKEKRSTVAFLDTQREMVVRELEIMTDHLARAKESNKPLDVSVLKSEILQDFAASMQKLKDGITNQIEDLIRKRNELTDEISNLIQMKDKGFQEYESLSSKNIQLAEYHNQLVHSIQDTMYKAGRSGSADEQYKPAPNGLGIYHHHQKDKSDVSVDLRNPNAADSSLANLLQDHDHEKTTVLSAPKVVDIRKGQPKKFNWKKGGHAVAKNVTKGFNRAFTSNSQYPNREDERHVTEGVPYGSMTASTEPSTSTPLSKQAVDPSKAAFGLFPQKHGANKATMARGLHSNSTTNLVGGDCSGM